MTSTFRGTLLAMTALLAVAATLSTAAEPTLEDRVLEEMSAVYASLLKKIGSTVTPGSREWDDALRASTRAVIAVKPEENCTDEFYAEHICFLRPMIVPTTAMAPTLEDGDAIMVVPASLDRPLRRGDVIAFDLAETNIFRVIGLQDETVELRNGIVHVDGVPLSREPTGETFLSIFGDRLSVFRERTPEGRVYEVAINPEGSPAPLADNAGPYRVPAGHYLVLGDNRHNAVDSRYPDRLGGSFVPAEAITGWAAIIYASRKTSRIGRRLD